MRFSAITRPKIVDLGLITFQKSLDFQQEIFEAVKDGCCNPVLILCRYRPVITCGRRADKKNILISDALLKVKGIDICETNRGGDVTYHGPGQLTVYPIFDLHYFKQDIHWFLRKLEDAAVLFFSKFGVSAGRKHGLTGVWVESEKIASIGIAVKNWITFHGLSLNIVKGDLANFQYIRPCGMDIKMTSLESVSRREFDIGSLSGKLIDSFREIFEFSSLFCEFSRQPALSCFRSNACPAPARRGCARGSAVALEDPAYARPTMPAPASHVPLKSSQGRLLEDESQTLIS